uniref:tRNA pseudouridine synthase B n=1 Tax=uncultured bacterium UPO33 TaxID=1776960 RepID=A0A126SXH0_9BACT|nr:tRNA pseudouridine synthase B [uncultured bacterium UPO33]
MLLIDKPWGLSSNRALQKAKYLYGAEKAGHTGTLDPLATGLLPICFGEATKFSTILLDADKHYVATVQLGVVTDTADAEGVVTERRPVNVARTEIEAALKTFLGESLQLPPMHSALKRDGKPLYAYARQGIVLDRVPRRIMIDRMQLLEWEGDRVVFEVACSKGTYVRTLAADLGERLGCGGHLAALRRTRIGSFDIGQAYPLQLLETLNEQEKDALLLPPDGLLDSLTKIFLGVADADRIRQGQAIRWLGITDQKTRVYEELTNRFLGVCRFEDGWLHPYRLMAQVANFGKGKLDKASGETL